ncbi:thiamine pyrophosphate-binding protein [Gemmatimonadota bacterium]
MRDLVDGFISHRLSRRDFVQSLAAVGVSAAGIAATVRSAEAVTTGALATGREVTGTGGELMVEQMKAAGVKYMFTNPGSFEVGLFDAFLDQPMQLIMGLHEGVVIAMADGYNKVSGEPAFVNVHVIAGTAQAAGQMYNASRDGSAIVLTAGLLDNELGDDDVLLGPRPGFDQKEVNRQFTKISWECHDSEGLPTMLRRAFKVATTAPGGPVYLAVPNHILEEKNVSGMIFPREGFILPDEIPPDQDDVDQVARMLLEARSPALFVGDEISRAGAQAEALELAELLHIPVGDQGLPAYHNFPRNHPLFMGGALPRREGPGGVCRRDRHPHGLGTVKHHGPVHRPQYRRHGQRSSVRHGHGRQRQAGPASHHRVRQIPGHRRSNRQDRLLPHHPGQAFSGHPERPHGDVAHPSR